MKHVLHLCPLKSVDSFIVLPRGFFNRFVYKAMLSLSVSSGCESRI